ncbi:katanin p80 WD40 repeat-containing subunit B1 isoform X2 [Prorops nasuta]|uniref:katanin p80 WD40 repeat-containing subunit B1 isoform X2 n=1 Tax=Prorops nasuta TaxID=863751 RepID=UPI0034CF5869
MASSTKRSWKLHDFAAHESNVNCLALGHKSGRVLVTGGDDKKVNLWAVGKQNCIMSLSGHSTPIECVKFGQTEDLVCAGSQTGALKIWDLEHAKLIRTLTGHTASIRCMEFHPYGELLASGSLDTGIKLWDTRRKGCIFTYKGHNRTVNSLKFSPDGQWIASAGEEGMVKLWDLRAGRQLRKFEEHTGPVTTVDFHPHEFLLASGGADKTIHFWDLESFELVSSTEQASSHAIRCLYFSQGGECLYAGSQDNLKVYGWEPARILDSILTGWGKVQDIAIAHNQLIGATIRADYVVLYVCNLKKSGAIGEVSSSTSPFSHGNSLRKSFSKEKPTGQRNHKIEVKTIEEVDKSGTDPEDEVTYADIPNATEYRHVFQPNRAYPIAPQILENLSTSVTSLNIGDFEDVSRPQPISSPSSVPVPTVSLSKPVPVRVQPLRSSLPIQKNMITNTSQIRTNLSNEARSKNFSSIPPLKQNITPFPGKRVQTGNQVSPPQPLGPQRSNSTLTPRVAAVHPVMDDGKLKNRVPSPDSPKHYLKRQSSCTDSEPGYESDYPVKINNIRHSPSDPALNRPNTAQNRSLPLSRNFSSSQPLSARNCTAKKTNKAQVPPNHKIDIRVPQLKATMDTPEKEEFVPMSADKPYGLDVETFLPQNSRSSVLGYSQIGVLSEMSEAEVLNSMMRSHEPMMAVLTSRHRSLQIVYSLWHSKDMKTAVESAVAMNDLSVIVDLLSIFTLKPTIWNLDLCNSLLGPIGDLLQSKYEMYVNVGSAALRIILKNFSSVIKSNVEAPLHTIGVDVSREERYHKCLSCYEKLSTIREILRKKQSTTGKMGASFRQLSILIRNLE